LVPPSIGTAINGVNENVFTSRQIGSNQALGQPYLDTKSLKCPHSERLPDRLSRLGYSKQRAVAMSGFLELLGIHRRSEKLKHCGTYLLFRDYFTVGKSKLSAGMFCQQHLLCPLCARLRAGRMLRKYTERVRRLVADQKSRRVSMLTFTIKNGDDLAERTAHLLKAFKILTGRARRLRGGGRNPGEFGKFLGGVGSVEVKRGKNSGLWHPHLHAIVLHDEWLDVGELRREWKEITGDSVNVDLRELECSKSRNFEELEGELQEVFKYAMKFSEMSLEDNWSAFSELRGKRLLRAWGSLWGVKIPDDLSDENELAEDLPFIERIWIYRKFASGYVEGDAGSLAWFKRELRRQGGVDGGTRGSGPPASPDPGVLKSGMNGGRTSIRPPAKLRSINFRYLKRPNPP
jgi:hypothetical protein